MDAGRQLSESRPGVGAIAGAAGRVLAAANAHTFLEPDQLRQLVSRRGPVDPPRPRAGGRLDRDPAPGAARGRSRPHPLGFGHRPRGAASTPAGPGDLHRLGARRRRTCIRRGAARRRIEHRARRGRGRTGRARRRDDLPDRGRHRLPRRDALQQDRDDGAGRGRCARGMPTVVACEIIKLAPIEAASAPEPSEAERALFEMTPPELISEIVTEEGATPVRLRRSARRPHAVPARRLRAAPPRERGLADASSRADPGGARRDRLHEPSELGQSRRRARRPTSRSRSRSAARRRRRSSGRCTVPPGGTLPDAAEACRKLGQIHDPFAPVPEGTACTQIYGGPEIADVSGTFNGKPVDTQFSRGNGCELERWKKVDFLFPGIS